MNTVDFDQLQQQFTEQGSAALLETLAKELRSEGRYHELFEVEKMRSRLELGLPIVTHVPDEGISEALQVKLEDRLLELCREVGSLLMRSGQIQAGWMYLRAVGDQRLAADSLAEAPVTDENREEYIGVALHEGVDVAAGYQMVLDEYGTCNSITTFESVLGGAPPAAQQEAAKLLLRHVHGELLANVKGDIENRFADNQETGKPTTDKLEELVAAHAEIFADGAYHLDTTHIASTVRFSRVLNDEESLRLALDLTHYGRHLDSQWQFPSEPPFADVYTSHSLMFNALLGESIDEAISYYRTQAEETDANDHGMLAIETYLALLAQLDRPAEALSEAIRLIPAEARMIGQAPSLLELATEAGQFEPLIDHCRTRGDILGFATALISSRSDGA